MILLTGTSGFIGKHLLSALIKKYGAESVIALTSKPIKECSYILHSDYHFEKDHFERAGFADSINTIIHAGAFTPKNNTKSNDWQLSNSNIFSTDKLLKATLPKLQKFIFLSTLDVYGKNEIISEASLVEPASLYGYSKLYCEKMITSWANTENKIFQLLRVGHVYGPGEEAYQKIIPVTIKKLIADQPLQLWGSGEDLRAFIYINDVELAILNSLDLKKSAGIINIVSAHKLSIRELIDKLIEVSGKKPVIEKMDSERVGRNLVFDNSKLKAYLLKEETSLDEGLYAEWQYMNQLANESFFDLDGTLIDSRERLYQLFQKLVSKSVLSFDDYWHLKRNKIRHEAILRVHFDYSEKEIVDFEKNWLLQIEEKEWLAIDKPFDGVTNFLIELKTSHKLYLVTARQFEINAMQQIDEFGWHGIFDHVFVTNQIEEKANAIKKKVTLANNDWILGDTGTDIEAGKELGINTAAILTGFRNKQDLEKYNPTIILKSVLDFIDIL